MPWPVLSKLPASDEARAATCFLEIVRSCAVTSAPRLPSAKRRCAEPSPGSRAQAGFERPRAAGRRREERLRGGRARGPRGTSGHPGAQAGARLQPRPASPQRLGSSSLETTPGRRGRRLSPLPPARLPPRGQARHLHLHLHRPRPRARPARTLAVHEREGSHARLHVSVLSLFPKQRCSRNVFLDAALDYLFHHARARYFSASANVSGNQDFLGELFKHRVSPRTC